MANAGLTWTKERIELLTKLWTEGLSASQIAAELGGDVSRNAVISKAHRLGLVHGTAKPASTPRTQKPSRPPEPATPAEPPAQKVPAPVSRTANQQPATQPEVTAVPVEVVAPQSEGVTIMELREGMCRWPLGDPTTPEFRYCGARAVEGLPYCSHHAQIAYQPAAERKRLRA
jgi:GcrA cell cycle regulator